MRSVCGAVCVWGGGGGEGDEIDHSCCCVLCFQSSYSTVLPPVEVGLAQFVDIRVVNFSDCQSVNRSCEVRAAGCSNNVEMVPEVCCAQCMLTHCVCSYLLPPPPPPPPHIHTSLVPNCILT